VPLLGEGRRTQERKKKQRSHDLPPLNPATSSMQQATIRSVLIPTFGKKFFS
jgi:hypothetical protein